MLALTDDGRVYSWGGNDLGSLGIEVVNELDSNPQQITTLTAKVVSIATGHDHSCAITENGQVYSWGNVYGQLGVKEISYSPVILKCVPNPAKKVVCGKNHVVALTLNGEVYCWGEKIANGRYVDEFEPIKVEFGSKAVDDIAVSPLTCLNACRTVDGLYSIWRQLTDPDSGTKDKKVNIALPLKVEYQGFHEIFRFYANNQAMHEPLTSGKALKTCPTSQFEMALFQSKQEYTDIVFLVEGKEIAAHKALLLVNCEYFGTIFAKEWKETKDKVIKIGDGIRHKIFSALLYFLYTNDVLVPNAKDGMDLLTLADCYLLPSLVKRCENLLKQIMSVDNVVDLFVMSSDSKKQVVNDFAFEFMVENWKDVAATKTLSLLYSEDLARLVEKVALKS